MKPLVLLAMLIALGFPAAACQSAPISPPAGTGAPAGGGAPAASGLSADQYAAQYGGDRAIYEDILNETDCAALEKTYDLAVQANSAAKPESAEARAAQGIIAAADARQEAAGCYN
jgi:hypothetical protein